MAVAYQSKGVVNNGALIGPGGLLQIASESPKLLLDTDGKLRYRPHNLFVSNTAPATQSITVFVGMRYTVKASGALSIALSGAGTGTATDGSPVTFTATTTSLTCTVSGAGAGDKAYVRELPSPDIDIDTPAAAPLFDLPYVAVGGAITKLRAEPETENLYTYNTDLTNAVWTKNGTTITADATASPIDGVSFDKVVAAAGSGLKRVDRSIAKAASSLVYTFSVLLKAAEWGFYHWQFDEGATTNRVVGYIDLSDGSLSTPSTGGTGFSATQEVEDLGGGVYRLKVTVTTNANTTLRLIQYHSDSASTTATGDGTAGLYSVGHQLELYPLATSTILTGAAARTRLADKISLSTDDFPWDDLTGSLMLEWSSPEAEISKFHGLLGFSGDNSTFWYTNTTGYTLYDGVTAVSYGTRSKDVVYKDAIAWNASGYQRASNGAAVTPEVTVLDFADAGDLLLGNRLTSDEAIGVTDFYRLIYVPRKWSEAELEAKTT